MSIVPPWPGERAVVTIGAYDGVHLGHQAVIAEVRQLAAERQAPGRSCSRSTATRRRSCGRSRRRSCSPTPEQRLELLAATGVDATVVLTFDEAQSKESPESFIERVLVGGARP